ncbi:uncharacterized protein LOC117890635 [Drosophila subobscura]|uniref:uncharacterized protein LOC117890635 n=1 Tax=Drosophila subobscura TaxID=7241 RepID=UPI00155A9A31|nr:uncharacterized protein LOC117890635 [Drosophila subobscura]
MAHFVHNPSEQNYYFKNSIAYTEDHIPVQKLYMFKIPKELNKATLYLHFSNFGRVLRMQFVGNNGGRPPNRFHFKSGWVFYEKTLDAAKALHSRIHDVNGCRFNVQASDSWHQPDAYGADAQDAEAEQLDPTILNLNDYCLEMVMLYLPMHDQMVLTRTCLRFRAVYQQATARLHRSIDLHDFANLTVWDLREFFNLSGTYVQHITGEIPPLRRSQRLCDFLSTNCLNLKTLTLHNSPLTPRNMYKIFAKMTKLEALELPQNMLTDEGISALKNCRSLKTLNISGNQIIGASLVKLSPTIESLTLSGCPRFQGHYLSNICKVLTNLKTLNLKGIDTMTFDVFQTMIKDNSGASLEVLRISAGPRETYEYVAQLPNLKSLAIYIDLPGRTLRSELFHQLAEHKAEKLERLEVYGGSDLSPDLFLLIAKLRGLRILILPEVLAMSDTALTTFSSLKMLEQINLKCSKLHDSSVFFLFDACPKLHILGLENCEDITEKLVHGIFKKVRADIDNKENQRRLPVQLCVSGTLVCVSGIQVKHPPDVKPKDILEVKYHYDCLDDAMDFPSVFQGHDFGQYDFGQYDFGQYDLYELDDLDDLVDLDDLDDDLDSDAESDYYGDDMFNEFEFISGDDSDYEIGDHPPGWYFMSLD